MLFSLLYLLRKWTYRRKGKPGRPPLDPRTTELILRLGRENPRWGYQPIRGELLKLGIRVSPTTIRAVLLRNGLDPAPRRSGPTWSEFLRSQAEGILAFDFFTVETVALKTLYVLFAIQLQTRRAHVAGATRNPDSAWVTQQARNLVMDDRLDGIRFVIRDRDAKFSGPFDEVFRTEGARSSARRSALRGPMPTPSDSCGQSAPSASTTCSSTTGATSSECSEPTWSTTYRRGPIEDSISRRHRAGSPGRDQSDPSSNGETSWVA